MNVITIFNYPKEDDNFTKMCYIWLDRVKIHGKGFKVKIFTETGVNEVLQNKIQECNFELVTLKSTKLDNKNSKHLHNVGFKLFNLCNEKEPFIFIDADAFVLEDLIKLKELAKNKPFVCINHETIPGHTEHIKYKFLNSGVQICNDNRILKFNSISKSKIVAPGTDQSMLFTYFNNIKYDYTHPKVGFEWNSYAKYVELYKDENGNWKGLSKGLDYEHPVYINHYWYDAKPWNINCKIFKEYEKEFESLFA